MIVTVRFIKYCAWSYNGIVREYRGGEEIMIDDKSAYEMVKHGYAAYVEDNLNLPEFIRDDKVAKKRKMRMATENKMINIESNENKEVI